MTPQAIIDSAVCLPVSHGQVQVDPWLALAERWHIEHSIIAPTDALVAIHNDEANAKLSALAKRYPRQLSALAVANPWHGDGALEILKRAFDMGCVGLYLHPARQGFRLTESIVDPLIALCVDLGWPIYSPTGTPVCCEPLQLAELARRFPQATFVLGHMGWSDFSGYDVIPAAVQARNILIETSCTTGGMVKMAIDALGPHRVLFGSGHPRSRPGHEVGKLHDIDLSADQMDLYLRQNARRVWKLKS